MATKLRSFSTHPLSKAAAVLLSALLVFLLVCALYDFAFDCYHSGFTPEALLASSYEESGEYYDWIADLAWDLYHIADSGSPSAEAWRLANENVLYRITLGGEVFTNAGDMTLQQLTPENGRWLSVENELLSLHLPMSEDYPIYSGLPTQNFPEGFSAVVYIPDEFIAQRQQAWELSGETLRGDLGYILACAVPFLLLTVFLCAVSGRVPADRELHCGRTDRIWTELLLLAFLSIAALFIAAAWAFVGESFYWNRGIWANRTAVVTLCGLSLCTGYLLSLPFFLAMVRKVKARCFFRHTAIGALLRFIGRSLRGAVLFLRGLFDGSAFRNYGFIDAMFRRRAAYITGSALCVLLFFLFVFSGSVLLMLLPLALEAAITWWYVRAGNEIMHDISGVLDQVSRISAGDLSWTPGLPDTSPLIQVSCQLSEIGGGMQKSVEKQMQSERMKVELVTNVSHDLKTPLTSIISYVDLLSKTPDLPAEARDYIAILAQKSDRLKSLVYDLFELAKSTSGSMEIHSEALDFHRLVEQTLAEMQERIEASHLALRVSLADAPVTIWADGRKLYRVLQNVIDNALKYSLAGTRIFVDLSVIGPRAVLSIKNTAGYEMDFSAEEITERFVRGDKARTAEGSGLGLSIAQSFTQACGGRFRVEVDGDQFKVHISFDLYTAQPEA